MVGCEKFGPRVPEFLVRPTSRGGLDKNYGRLKNCALLLLRRIKVLSMSFSLLAIPWIENFGCKVTHLGPLDFQASHWLKFCSSWPLAFNVKQALPFNIYTFLQMQPILL
jgi:hypothetical protein